MRTELEKMSLDELIKRFEELESETIQLLVERDELSPSRERDILHDRVWDNQEEMDKIERIIERNRFKKIPNVSKSQWEKVGFDFGKN